MSSITNHIVPTDDIAEHELSEECGCKPMVTTMEDDGVILGFVVIHNAWDRRSDISF